MLVARSALFPVLAAVLFAALFAAPLAAVESERLDLSGRGFGDTREWEFRIEDGRRAGEGWTTIAVPSQWEQQGFGTYRYGRHDGSGGETGHYRHRFAVPPEWRQRRVRLVFGGVMTDTEARLNGRLAGPVHRGGFTRFSYDVTDLLDFDRENLLEVRVDEKSADRSVDRAERDADYWVFGGIYRPVWLEASPPASIAHVAIDARHDGRLTVKVEVVGNAAGARVVARVHRLDGEALGGELAGRPGGGAAGLSLSGSFPGARPWSAERPRLHELRLRLLRGDRVLHTTRRRFGFRTFEVRAGEGLFVNGRRVLLRGINRHSFWPQSGRTLNDEINRRDAELLKELNANAVRASHYPPDEAFLDACDELGLYVIDELPGWHDAYDEPVGEKLVAEMVRRDVNHPSILFWANGNEGGWNPALDDDFARHDPQGRPVLHPDDEREGIATFHYPTYSGLDADLRDDSLANRLRRWLDRERLLMPTEMLHGLYDGGLGAGLEGFWEMIRRSRRAAGGFLWAFLDEGIARTDRGGEIDTFGNYAPDGLVGPYREKEASFRTVRRVWSPIRVEPVRVGGRFDGSVRLENRFHEIGLEECRFDWRAVALPGPGGEVEELASGTTAGPPLAPGRAGVLRLDLPAAALDAVELTAVAPSGREIETWTLPVAPRADLLARWIPEAVEPAPVGRGPEATGERIVWRLGQRRVELRDGTLTGLFDGATRIPLDLGPRRLGGAAAELRRGSRLDTGSRRVYHASFDGALAAVTWTLFPSGWLRLEYELPDEPDPRFEGVTFELPDPWVRAIEWLGRGPDPVWLNRRRGPRLGRWRRLLSDATPGRPARGYYEGVRWMRLAGADGVLTVVPGGEHLVVSVSAPRFPQDARNARAETPATGTLGFLHRITPMGTKFHPGRDISWGGLWQDASRERTGTVWFHWQAARLPRTPLP